MTKTVKKTPPGGPARDSRRATDADRMIGAKIRARRIAARMSQDKLASAIGITFQQIQKYESGSNRVAAGVLLKIASALGVPIEALLPASDDISSDNDVTTLLKDAQTLAVVRAFARIQSAETKRLIVKLAETLATLNTPEGSKD
ncbi:MAG: helix-turn-helix domain-containing protein [Hyphomonadaceae bacterium]